MNDVMPNPFHSAPKSMLYPFIRVIRTELYRKYPWITIHAKKTEHYKGDNFSTACYSLQIIWQSFTETYHLASILNMVLSASV